MKMRAQRLDMGTDTVGVRALHREFRRPENRQRRDRAVQRQAETAETAAKASVQIEKPEMKTGGSLDRHAGFAFVFNLTSKNLRHLSGDSSRPCVSRKARKQPRLIRRSAKRARTGTYNIDGAIVRAADGG